MADESVLKVLGISGSLRKGSYNSAALRAAQELAPAGMTIDIFDRIGELPLYDEDVRQQGFPPAAEALRDAIRSANALLFATPEYNYSISGVLKNAIDWASRPPEQPFAGKPIGVMGAAGGVLGTARAQYHLRQCFIFLDGRVLNRPEVFIGGAPQKFDADGRLTDEGTRKIMGEMLQALADWTNLLKRGAATL